MSDRIATRIHHASNEPDALENIPPAARWFLLRNAPKS